MGVPLLNGFLHVFILSYTKERGERAFLSTYSLWSLKWESPARNRDETMDPNLRSNRRFPPSIRKHNGSALSRQPS
ncbi:hypothetical protein B1694_04965 [Geobacillus zalihae]|nr:hypothetical protein B1694_04965 [Geobacillus zalihae]